MPLESQERAWTLEQVRMLMELVREQVPVRLIALKTKRSELDVHAKLAELGLLAPAVES